MVIAIPVRPALRLRSPRIQASVPSLVPVMPVAGHRRLPVQVLRCKVPCRHGKAALLRMECLPGRFGGRPFPDPAERRTISAMAQWWSIEVLHGEFSAFRWQEQHDSALIEAALTNGAVDGSWHADRWGVVFEVCFGDEEQWETFRSLPAVRAALDAAPYLDLTGISAGP